MRLFVILWITFWLAACGGSNGGTTNAPPVPTYTYQQPPLSICDTSMAVSNGLLCVFQPSRLDAGTRDVFGNGSPADFILGFGYHVVAFPPTGTNINGVYVHFTGSYGRPYNQSSGAFGNAPFLDEALSAGYITIQLAYHNRFSVNLDECGGDPAKLLVDNCSGDVRMEKIVGVNVSSLVDTPAEDGIEFRLTALVDYLQTNGFEFPFAVVSNNIVNWPSLRVGGHSQGATHALYLYKYFFAQHACLLAGGYDIPDAVPAIPPENLADWLLDDTQAVDVSNVRALVAIDDSSYASFIRAYEYLGMLKDTHYREVSGAPYADIDGASISGHGAVLQDPRYAAMRLEACFSG